ncbi:hypothetical protein CYLTODRAFT_476146 [Cylindrobasidium torrendii FP15055 ss-10]|uniref:Uncharacterized protein n=1 Tax=Cylindrobasidium torrendii FP15055 ss-10 TaxID=1314674 RepID=A0A0D7AW18_9AGAR|nr:hypothetical protein CYLTODRAFT_476146 [Cylindrobasidium torrendii FP15055 ss-10]
MVRVRSGRDKTPLKQMLLAPPKKPADHTAGDGIVEFSLHWAKIFLALEGNKKAYARAKQDCREGWDNRVPVEDLPDVERRALSKKRFKKDVWPFINWGMKRILHLKDARGFYVPRSKIDAFRHLAAVAAAAAERPRPRPVPVGHRPQPAVNVIPGAAPPPVKQESRPPVTPIKEESLSPVKQEPRTPVLVVGPPARRYRATPYPRKKSCTPRIKKESVSPRPLLFMRSPTSLVQSPMRTSPRKPSVIPDTPPRPCNGKKFQRLFSVDADTEDVPLRDASPVRGGIRTRLPRWDLDDEDYAYNDCDMFGA